MLAGEHNLSVILVTLRLFWRLSSCENRLCRKGADRADFKIVQLANKEDIVTKIMDYLFLLPKGCRVVHHKGMNTPDENIERLLQNRHLGHLKESGGAYERTKAFH